MFDLWIKIHSIFQSEQLKEMYETLQSKICENYYWSLWMQQPMQIKLSEC